MSAFLSGFALSLSTILVIGAQNAFVLRQGLRRAHVGAVVAVCILSEAVLIFAGVMGIGSLLQAIPLLGAMMRWLGAAFLTGYGLLALGRAMHNHEGLRAAEDIGTNRRAAVLTCLALTWLNPHVYLDTVVLIGTVSAQYAPDHWHFGLGAATASALFFLALGYGAVRLQPVFASPAAWRILDAVVGLLMLSIAAVLIFG